jgi:hypothetical protein
MRKRVSLRDDPQSGKTQLATGHSGNVRARATPTIDPEDDWRRVASGGVRISPRTDGGVSGMLAMPLPAILVS